ncbi:restriction endonuclease subunit S [Pseudomonas sp. SWRI81]|uniref:restriction endonuclease subunit S n=1 Tax=Pseudomonas sp. SWRI81 TaxID=2745505 RepID=UPI00192D7E8F|nr:restriction endonuclease subunit S [Pseudomonas sp. SWRI81]
MSELPNGWMCIAVSQVCAILRGVTYNKMESSHDPQPGYVPVLRANNIQEGKLVFSDLVYVPESCVAAQQLIKAGDVVVAMSSGSKSMVGKAAKAGSDWLGSFGAFCGVLRPSNEIDPRYFYFFSQSAEYRSCVSELSAGVNINNLKPAHFDLIEIPVAPRTEQNRIAQKLDELLAQVDTLKARIDAVPVLLKRFRQSVLASATSGRLTEEWRALRISREITAEQTCGDGSFPPGWKVRPLKKLVTKIEQGWSPKCESVSASDDEWAVIKTTAIQPISFGPLENKKLPTTLLPRPELTIVVGDILITRAGPRSRAAVCCYVKATQPKLMVCDKAYRFKAIEEEFSGLLLCYFLNSPQFVRALDDLKTGISESGVNLTMKKFQDLELPQPPTEEQTEIVRRVEQLFAFADQLEAKVASAKSRIDHLTQSILAKAFRGELVPQDPNDEPASVLLKRIKAQRAAAPKAKRGRKVSA